MNNYVNLLLLQVKKNQFGFWNTVTYHFLPLIQLLLTLDEIYLEAFVIAD